MSLFRFLSKLVFFIGFLSFFNINLFCTEPTEDDGIKLTLENIQTIGFNTKINGKPIRNYYKSSVHTLDEIPKFLHDYVKNVIETYEKSDKKSINIFEYSSGESIYTFKAYNKFNIKYNVYQNDELQYSFEQDRNLNNDISYKILKDIVFPESINKEGIIFDSLDFLDTVFYSNILNKAYFKNVKFKDGTLTIDVNVEELLKIVQRHFSLLYELDKELPFKIHQDSFNCAEKKISNKGYSTFSHFSKLYSCGICDSLDYEKFSKYFNCEISTKYEPLFRDGEYNIFIKWNIDKVNCNDEDKFKGALYPDLYYFDSCYLNNFGVHNKLLEENENSYRKFFIDYINDDGCKKLLEEEALFHFYKVIESINLDRIKEYSVFFQNIVYFIKDYVIPYEEKLLFEQLRKIEFKEYLNAEESKVEEFFYNKAIGIIKSKDSVFKDFYTLFFYDKNIELSDKSKKNKITGVYFDDLSKKDELKMEHVKLLSLKKLIDEFRNKYIERDKKVNKELEYSYINIDASKSLKEQFINIIKAEDIIEKDIVEDFLKRKNFSIPISGYITWYCEKIYKEQFESTDKKTLKSFIEKLNKKGDLFKEIKTSMKDLNIEEKYFNYFSVNKNLDDLIRELKTESLKSLSKIFVDEIINDEKENVINKIVKGDVKSYISDLQNKKEEYNKDDKKDDKDKDKYTNIETLLNRKKTAESVDEVTFKEEDIKNILNELNKEINGKLNIEKIKLINSFIDEQKNDIKNLIDLTKYAEYLTKFNKKKDEAGSIKQLLKNKLNTAGFKEEDIEEVDYNLDALQSAIDDKKRELDNLLAAKLAKEDNDKLTNIKNEIKKISDNIIKDIKAINSKDSLKKCIYKDDVSITNEINSELVKLKLDYYDEFIKKEITDSNPKQTFGDIIISEIKTNVTRILGEYKKIEDSLCIVNINYTLSDEDKITDKGKNEFNKLNVNDYKKFDSRKKYKDLYILLKSVSVYFKNIDLVDSSTLISIENKDEVIEKDNITINIKLVESCYKKDEHNDDDDKHDEEHDDDDKHNEEHNDGDDEHKKEDPKTNGNVTEEDIKTLNKTGKTKNCCQKCYTVKHTEKGNEKGKCCNR